MIPRSAPARTSRPRRQMPIARTSRPRRQRKSSIAALKRKLWSAFAAYVKERDGNVCFTCDKPVEGQNSQAGHLVSRRYAATFYDPANVHVQCGSCNCGLRGNLNVYTLRFLDRYGEPKFRALLAKSREIKHWTGPELVELWEALTRGGADFEMVYSERYGVAASLQAEIERAG